MRQFKSLLFVTNGIHDDSDALKQAIALAVDHNAKVTVLISYPDLPRGMADYTLAYEKQRLEIVEKRVADLTKGKATGVNIEIEGGALPADRIVRRVLKNKYDVVVKAAADADGKGFAALDMDLLRKCPCPVWLCRPLGRKDGVMDIAVAIDPRGDEDDVARGLSLNLLQLASRLAAMTRARLNVVSCWDYAYEDFMRNSSFGKTPEPEIRAAVEAERSEHLAAVESLLAASGIEGYKLHHLRGRPETMIPDLVVEANIDLLVMGTVARTGIPGFLIGNTAENILRRIPCSLMAAKPDGFVSPVKA